MVDAEDVFPLDATETSDLDGDGIGDNSDPDRDGDGVNNEDDYFPDDPNASSVPTVQITSPATLITVGSSPITVEGTIDDQQATIVINGIEVVQNSGAFAADVALKEGANTIIVRAIDANDHEGTATISVSLDKTPPYITFESPKDGDVVYSDTIPVSGLVNDIVRGTVSESDAVVTVNSIPAKVSNRSYLAENVSLQEGENTITVTATDAVGNEATAAITVNYQPQRERRINLVSGQAQTAAIQQSINNPLLVQLLEDDVPVVNKPVIFRVIQGDGLLQPGTVSEANGAVVQTDSLGQAQVNFQLGSRAGNGNHKVRVRAVGFEGEVVFYASATYGNGIQMGIIEGNNQRGSVRQPLPKPLVLAITDAGANLIPNAQIEFKVIKGGGKFNNGETTYLTTTDTDGRASASFILGPEKGLDVQRVTATLVGTATTAGFTASGFVPGDPGQTAISGVVLDNQDQPMPGVTIRVDGSSRQAVADEQGQFTLTEAPVGPVHLLVEGSTTTRPGEWPSLSYNIVTVPGVNNPLASPIYLVEIDTENAVFVGEEDTIVTHPEIPGFALEVPAGSVTFPDGSKTGYLSITRVNANKIPMAPPNGMQPQLIVTIQPHGALFDPPAKLTIPNTDGHAPGAQIEMYSYDHDLEEFVTIGLGTVSVDGSTITSNKGSGVIKAGWHCGSQPGGSGCCEDPPDCDHCYDLTGDCPGNCELVPERTAETQTPGNCQEELCSGSNLDDSDDPKDQECVFCKDGNPEFTDEHIQKKQQDPHDCKVLFCDGEDEDAPNETLPDDQQTPNDCKELRCDGQEVAANDPREDTNMFDCSEPVCDGTTHSTRFAPEQHRLEETIDACKTTRYECSLDSGSSANILVEDNLDGVSPQSGPNSGSECYVCENGTEKQVSLNDCQQCVDGVIEEKPSPSDVSIQISGGDGRGGEEFEFNECENVNAVIVDFEVDFTADSSCNPTYRWNFGNGKTSTQRNPSTYYQSAGTYLVTVEVSCAECSESTTVTHSVLIKEGRTLNEIEADYRKMISGARSIGWNVAADNLAHFLSATGTTRTISSQWLLGFSSVREAADRNLTGNPPPRFEAQIRNAINSAVPGGNAINVSDYWEAGLYANIFTEAELYYASGGSNVRSSGNFSISKASDGTVSVVGGVSHLWNDPYDWHAGLNAPVPSFGSGK